MQGGSLNVDDPLPVLLDQFIGNAGLRSAHQNVNRFLWSPFNALALELNAEMNDQGVLGPFPFIGTWPIGWYVLLRSLNG